jgi:hypothetical protein
MLWDLALSATLVPLRCSQHGRAVQSLEVGRCFSLPRRRQQLVPACKAQKLGQARTCY